MEGYHYAKWRNGRKMLYDHSRDPDENLNVANNPECLKSLIGCRAA